MSGLDEFTVPVVATVVDRFGNIMLPEEGFTASVIRDGGASRVRVATTGTASPGPYSVYISEGHSRITWAVGEAGLGFPDSQTPSTPSDLAFAQASLTVTSP